MSKHFERKKCWLFGGECYYAKGGLNDLISTADTSAPLKELAESSGLDWWHIVNADTLEVIARSESQAFGVERNDFVPD